MVHEVESQLALIQSSTGEHIHTNYTTSYPILNLLLLTPQMKNTKFLFNLVHYCPKIIEHKATMSSLIKCYHIQTNGL